AGMKADLALWDIQDAAELTYQFGVNPLIKRWYDGVVHVPAYKQ
ncbi:MAG TPA: imidazolonepropionase, partial [Idiomarina baltica]|nr:imidazolonepropionase [Idiomarina baltica]